MSNTPFAPDTRAVYQASVGDLPVTLIAFEGDVAGKRYYFGNIHAPGFGESHGIEESLLITDPAQVAALFAEIDPASGAVRIAVNPHFAGKVAKDAPDQVWGAFNSSFQHVELTLDELAAHIQQGHSITAICRGKRKTENFISRQDLGADFDTEDQRSALDTLQAHPFVAQHGALLHTTSSHKPESPRARVIFLLDKPVTDPKQYSEYAQALIWFFGIADAKCKDPARVWFGAHGCTMRVLGNVLPCSVMDELVTRWKEAQPEPLQRPQTAPSVDDQAILNQAVIDGHAGNRNNTGFWLACRLRDTGYPIDHARETMLLFQQTVERLGNHPYLAREATDSLASAYSHKPRVDISIDSVEDAVIAGTIRVSANVQKTLFGVLSIMRKTGKTRNVALALRSVEQACFGFVDKSTVADHLAVLVEDGLLERTRKSNRRIGSLYTLTYPIPDKSGHSQQDSPPTARSVQTCPVSDTVSAQHYSELQAEPICAIRAQIHPAMARDDSELIHSFGASAQRILATLQTLPDGVDSLETLAEIAHLSSRTAGRKVSYLAAHNIVDTVKVGTRLQVKLNKYWRENIDAITPALTSFGQDILRAERAANQQIAHHEHMAFYTANADEKAMSEATIERAEQTVKLLAAHKAEAMLERRQWMQDNGMYPAKAPPLSLHPRSNPKHKVKLCLGKAETKAHLPPGNNKTKLGAYRAMKRRLTPSETAKVNKNGLTKAELAQLIVDKQMMRVQLGDIAGDDFGSMREVPA